MTTQPGKAQKQQLSYSPIDNSVYVKRTLATQPEIDKALNLAAIAHRQWKKTTMSRRKELCLSMLDAFEQNRTEIAQQLCWMIGRPIQYAQLEIDAMVERARYMIDIAEQSLASITLPKTPGFRRYIKREPLGVVLVIAPWNYPYLTAINTIIPALISGNSVILKHSAQTPLCAEQLAKAFKLAGLPEGVFQYLHLSHSDTEQIAAQPQIKHVAFTGSVAGGKAIERACCERFIGVGLELGGKDPAYVRADADIEHAVASCIDGAFFNSGQSCCAIERIYVASEIYDDFVKRAVAQVYRYTLGRPDDMKTTLGPVINSKAGEFVRRQISDAISAGAVAHIDPNNFQLDRVGTAYLAPQVVTNVDHNMRLMSEESFGPVVGIMKVANDNEAIALMNDSEFGLTACVFSNDIDVAVDIGEQLETGTFFVNRCDYLDPALAWAGIKNSGRGCTLSSFGYQSLTRPKSFHLKMPIRESK